MRLPHIEIELTSEQAVAVAKLREVARNTEGRYYLMGEPKQGTDIIRITAISERAGNRIKAVITDLKKRGPRNARKNCKCCGGSGYIVGSCGSHDCDCTREV